MSIVTDKAIIREMDADEVKEYVMQVIQSDKCDDVVSSLLMECAKQYIQLTGTPLDINELIIDDLRKALIIDMEKYRLLSTYPLDYLEIERKKPIESMDAEQLLEHLHQLGTAQDCLSHHTGAQLLSQAQQVCNQYRQLTGQQLTADTPGLSIVAGAMVHAVSKPEILGTL